MNALPVPLEFEGYPIRVIDRNGIPWWVLAEVCRVLELDRTADAANRLDEDEKGVDIVDTLGGPQEMTIISEPALYKLIQTSRKPAARRFDRWVRHEVLPSIRKTGSYGAPDIGAAIIAGMEAMGRAIGIRFDGQDRVIAEVKDDIAKIKAKLFGGRRSLSPETKREHIEATSVLGGKCPCCRLNAVVGNEGKLPFAEYDHFYQNSYPSADHTWLICKPCHTELTHRIPRDQRLPEFSAYQQQRRRLPGGQPRLF